MAQLPLISLQQVSKTFSPDLLDYEHLAMKNVSLDIADGEFVIIYGPSGSGKSTLLNLMAGLEQPTSGRVLVRGRDLAEFDNEDLAVYHRLNMGMVFQNFNLIKSLRVWENVALPQTASGVRYKTRFQRAKHLLKIFGLGEYLNRHTNELSGGEQQRVAIARALINNPYFLLVDEPTGNLDTKSAEDVMQIFNALYYQSNHTIVLVTHNIDYTHYASRVLYLQDGQIVQEQRNKQQADTLAKLLGTKDMSELAAYRAQASETPLEQRVRAEYSPILFGDYPEEPKEPPPSEASLAMATVDRTSPTRGQPLPAHAGGPPSQPTAPINSK